MVQLREFHITTGIPISREQYTKIKAAYASAKKKYWKEGAVAMDIEEYMRSFKKDSKKFRQVLSYEAKAYDITKLTQVNTLARITNTTVPSESRIRNMHGTWGRRGLNNQLRVYSKILQQHTWSKQQSGTLRAQHGHKMYFLCNGK
jgi:hypothetical protein